MTPGILLFGAGRFGLKHLHTWKRLAAQGAAHLVGIVVARESSLAALREHAVPLWLYRDLTDDDIRQADAVDIVTPPATHAALIRRCLPLAHVLVEKPMTLDPGDAAGLEGLARQYSHVLMVGHVFRFHPVVRELKRLVSALPELPRGIHGTMINPCPVAMPPEDAPLELPHLFDIIDFLFGLVPDVVEGRRKGRLHEISLRYPGPMNALLRIGPDGDRRVRTMECVYSDRRIVADLIDHSIVVSTRNNQLTKHFFSDEPVALVEELRTFTAAMRDPATSYPDAAVGGRIVRTAVTSRSRRRDLRPRIAVVGGGIFGATCALECSTVGEVTLFERNEQLLVEVSANNQARHHSGFHYPRSYDSVVEIAAARQAFEAEYGAAIIRGIPSYYCTSTTGIEIPAERYLAACQSNRLSFTVEAPPDIVDASQVSLCLKTDEGVYDVAGLRRLVTGRLAATPAVRCQVRSHVISGVIAGDGSKRLTSVGPDGTREESFDYVINATYAHRNLVALWFGFPIEPLRFDLYELLLLRLPVPQICVTVLDGPFTSLVGTGIENQFLLSHIHDSVSRSVIPDDGAPPQWLDVASNQANMLRHSTRYLPVLRDAFDVQSRWVTRAVNAFARDFDARPTVITEHGFGCWSMLGGKVITCVANAREIAKAIAAESSVDATPS